MLQLLEKKKIPSLQYATMDSFLSLLLMPSEEEKDYFRVV